MKIGYDAKRLYCNFTGLGNYSRTLVGNIIKLFPQDELYLYTPKRKISDIKGAITRIPHSKHPFWRSFGVIKDLKRDGVEIFHGLSHDLPFGIHRSGIKSVVTIHDVCYRTFPEMFPLVERIIYGIKYRHSCRRADKIIAISESTKRDIIRYFGTSADRIEVVYQSINPIYYEQQENPREKLKNYNLPEKYILYVGSLNSRKNLLGLLEAYVMLPKEHRLPMVVVGNGSSYKDKVLKFIDDNLISDQVIMLDSVRDTQTLQAFYQCAELFVYPSFYEGFGLPVTEALLSGTPVITSNVSSLPEAGGDGALYIDPAEPREISASISRVLSDDELRKSMVARGLEYARATFSPDKLTREVRIIYEKLGKQ